MTWVDICQVDDLLPNAGIAALVDNKQVAVFKIGEQLFALDNHDPFSNANVLSRGIVGNLDEQLVVASPIYKQHFTLETGQCLEDDTVSVPRYAVRTQEGRVQVHIE